MTTMAKLREVQSDGISPFLHCYVCGDQYSANPADYWDTPNGHVFKCCDEPMALVRHESLVLSNCEA